MTPQEFFFYFIEDPSEIPMVTPGPLGHFLFLPKAPLPLRNFPWNSHKATGC